MMKRQATQQGCMKSLLLTTLILCFAWTLEARSTFTALHQNKETLLSQNQENLLEVLRRSKRYVGDFAVTDKLSRGHASHSRQALLFHLLSLVDTSMGSLCSCLLEGKSRTSHEKCRCDVTSLLSTLLQTLKSPKSIELNRLEEAVEGFDQSQKNMILETVGRELHKAKRAKAVEKMRLRRLRIRMMRRRRMLLNHPRSAFDGKQLVSF